MKILFVCKGNMVRSQMAEEFYNLLRKDQHKAESAGTVPGTISDEPEGWQLDQISYLDTTLLVMNEMGLDISKKRTRRITQEMVNASDLVINMAEKETLPDFLINEPKVIFWNVQNPSRDIKSIIATKNEIWELVEDLIDNNLHSQK